MFRQAPGAGWVPNGSDRLKALVVDAGCPYLQVRGRLRLLFPDKAASLRLISCCIKCYNNILFMLWRILCSGKVFSYSLELFLFAVS